MASRLLDALKTVGTHEVGNLNSWNVKVLPYGAIVTTAAVDNFTLVELGFNSDGERTCKQLAAKGNKAYLVAAPEERFVEGEQMVDFYNAVDDRARVVIMEPYYTRFDTSAFALDEGDAEASPARAEVTTIANGQVAHFDVTSKKFIISAAATPHPDYAGSSAQFIVVSDETDMAYLCGKATIRLEVTKA
jgi:hypothetical protein